MAADVGVEILSKAKELGATLAGIARVDLLRQSPSHQLLRQRGLEVDGIGSLMRMPDMHEVKWPDVTGSAVVIAVSHPEDKPELDLFTMSGNSPGNQLLIDINRQLAEWIEETFAIKVYRLPYSVEEGGAFLKDAAHLAGLGSVGRNNLLVTRELGPRVRLRGMLLDAELEPTGPIRFDPCADCDDLCRKACPQNAFSRTVLSPDEAGTVHLPGRDGSFGRSACFRQIVIDVENAGAGLNDVSMEGGSAPSRRADEARIKYCRQCEFACPVGRQTE
jgi:epoxyqueuosine reductase